MGQAIAVRTDFTAGEVRRFAKRLKDAAQAPSISAPIGPSCTFEDHRD